jgi:hypothetical protein
MDSGNGVEVGWSSRLGGACSNYNVHDVIVRNMTAEGLFIHGVTYTYVVGGNYGHVNALSSVVAGCNPGSGPESHTNHLAIDGATWQDDIQTGSGQHLECIHWFDGKNSVVRNSRFLNCAQFDISFQPTGFPNGDVSNFLLENNVLDVPCSHQGSACGSNHTVAFACNSAPATTPGIVVRYNSFPTNETPQFLEGFAGCFVSVPFYGNTGGGPPNAYVCTTDTGKGVNYTNNVWTTSNPCGTNNSTGNPANTLYTNPTSYNFTPPNNAPEIDYIPTGTPYPPTDITGTPRPQHAKPDAGAYELP